MLEFVKSVGAFVGLITGAFYFYDRFAKGRPIASLTISIENNRPSPRIRISNASAYDIAVLDITTHPSIYLLAEEAGATGQVPLLALCCGRNKIA